MSEPEKFPPHACKHCGGDGWLKAVNPTWLRWRRLQSRATLRVVARAAGVSVPFVCDVEYGRRNCNAELLAAYEQLSIGAPHE